MDQAMNDRLPRSYAAAGEFPWKLLRYTHLLAEGTIPALHLQFSPTNRCNRDCSWCCYRRTDRSLELPEAECLAVLDHFHALGTKAVTFTGGGEPTVHGGLGRMVAHAARLGLRVGLVTNGVAWLEAPHDDLGVYDASLTWVRLSLLPDTRTAKEMMQSVCRRLPRVDVGGSYVVTDEADRFVAPFLADVADGLPNFKYLRFLDNLLAPAPHLMAKVMGACDGRANVFFQSRGTAVLGERYCWVSLLKPHVHADGFAYPCCGVPCATDEEASLPPFMRMCHWSAFPGPDPFDGSVCKHCWHADYNRLLDGLHKPLAHGEFV